MIRRETGAWIGYIFFTLLEELALFVVIMARQIHDWALLVAATASFLVAMRANYTWMRRQR